MQNEWWMRPALQKSEAVLLPALPRTRGTMRFDNRLSLPVHGPFRPVTEEWKSPSTELSTYVRPRGSMAGRSVLRAVGVCKSRYMSHPVRRRW